MTLSLKNPIALLVAVIAILASSFFLPVTNCHALDDGQSADSLEVDIETLIAQLDSRIYKEREKATEALGKADATVIARLTRHFFDGSSEAEWRINRILENICKSEDDATFLKSAAVIQVLFNSRESRQRLEKILVQRTLNHRERAAQSLREAGFRITLPEQPQAFAAIGPGILLGGDGRIVVSHTGAPVPSTNVQPIKSTWQDPLENKVQTVAKIDEIISNSTEQNRKLLRGLLSNSRELQPSDVVFPESKKQISAKSMDLLVKISPIGTVTFNGQRITAELLESTSDTTTTSVNFIGCTFASEKKPSLPPNLRFVSFKKKFPEKSFFISQQNQFHLHLDEVELDKPQIKMIEDFEVNSLSLRECQFSAANLQTVLLSPQLSSVDFSLCRIDIEAIRQAKQLRPGTLEVTASPEAIMGVSANPGQPTSCIISQVVPESGAAKGGVKPLDIVTSVNGQSVADFDELRLLISAGKAGDKVEIQVIRNGKTVDLSVELGKL